MSDKVFRTCPITRLERFGRETVLWIQAPDIAAKAVAGQFVMVGLPRPRANFLKRAISIHAIDGAEVALAVLTVGDVSVALSRLTVGDSVEVIGPLGNGFDLDIQGRPWWPAGSGMRPSVFWRRPWRTGGRTSPFTQAVGTGQPCPAWAGRTKWA